MEEQIVIVGYKPKEGQEQALHQLTREHYIILKNEGLVTDRVPIIMVAKDGTIIEVFGWKSKEAIEQAHTNPAVLAMWGRYAGVCDYIPVGTVPEAANLFSGFAPLNPTS